MRSDIDDVPQDETPGRLDAPREIAEMAGMTAATRSRAICICGIITG
jgi:hypothetical protein